MFDRVLNTPQDDKSRLDRSCKCVLLWKPSVFMVLPTIRNQSKAETIPHTVFEKFINSNSRYKFQKVSQWVLWIGEARNIYNTLHKKRSFRLTISSVDVKKSLMKNFIFCAVIAFLLKIIRTWSSLQWLFQVL